MIRETAGESALELAARRLDKALGALEQKLAQGQKPQAQAHAAAPSGPADGDLFARDEGQAELAAELDRARERERQLEAAGAEASAALGRAIQEIRAALGAAPQAAEG